MFLASPSLLLFFFFLNVLSQAVIKCSRKAFVWGFPGDSDENLPAVRETWVLSWGGEDPLEEGMATHSSILAWRIPMDRGAWWAVCIVYVF